MIERLRLPRAVPQPANRPAWPTRKKREFDVEAQNYERVDFLNDGEVVLGKPTENKNRDVLAHVSFVERLYVQGQRGRLEFGVRRAFVSVVSDSPGMLSKVDELRSRSDHKNVIYIPPREAPHALTVCIDPVPGSLLLAELSLPPTDNENRLSKIGTTAPEVRATQLKANLLVSFDVEGLYIADDNRQM
jgi:hypothetical protein